MRGQDWFIRSALAYKHYPIGNHTERRVKRETVGEKTDFAVKIKKLWSAQGFYPPCLNISGTGQYDWGMFWLKGQKQFNDLL